MQTFFLYFFRHPTCDPDTNLAHHRERPSSRSFPLGSDSSFSCWLDMDAQNFIFITISFECLSLYQIIKVVNIQPGVENLYSNYSQKESERISDKFNLYIR